MDSRNTPHNDSQPELFAGRFEILAHLGTGLVGDVRRARDTQDPNDKDGGVALKILRSGQDPSLIKSEALTLQTLWQEEEKLKDGFHAAPRLFLADPGAERPFLAMEFIRGKQIPDLLRESDARHFDEPTALNVAMQLFRILSVLHEGLNKTFIDLKMENLWWQEENGVRLRVTDWNVLEERHPIAAGKTDPVLVDIFRASVSLYWMLIGELPDLQSNLKVRKLQRALNWDELSDGAKKLLSRLFSHKFETAMQAQRELERLLQYWKMDAASLVSKAKEFVSNDVEKASEIVSILRKRNTQPDKDFNALENVLKETWSQRDDPTKSISLFSAGSYSTALVLIENAYPYTSQPHVFRWWRQAVELTSKLESSIKKSMPDSNPDEKVERIREFVVKSVNAYFSKQYADAEQYFSKLSHDLPSEQEIKRIYEELLDVLMGLQFYEQAESQREQASDEDAKTQRDLYKAAMENYEQARRKALTVSRDLLPEAISSATLEDSIKELQNKIKALSRAAKGNWYFKKGQIELALDVWRDGFRLDPDHPELMDFVLSAVSESVGKGALDEASMLLDIIPMSGYSFACAALRKKINDARQKQVEQNELPGNSEANSEEQAPLDILKYEEANFDMTLARRTKSSDFVRSRDAKNSAIAKVLTNKVAIKRRTKSQASDRKTITSKVALTKVSEENSYANETKQPQKSQLPAQRREVGVGNEARLTKSKILGKLRKEIIDDDKRKIKRNELMDLEKEVFVNKNKTLTLDGLNKYVETALEILHKIDLERLDQYCVASWKNWENYSSQLSKGQELWERARKASLEERKETVKDLKEIGFIGKAEKFETELGLNILEEVHKARKDGSKKYYEIVERRLRESWADAKVREFLEKEFIEVKNKMADEAIRESAYGTPEFYVNDLRNMEKRWLGDPKLQEAITAVFEAVKRKYPKPPEGWVGIDYLRAYARLDPQTWERKTGEGKTGEESWRNWLAHPFVQVRYGEEIENIRQEIQTISNISPVGMSLAGELERIFKIDDPTFYREKIGEVIKKFDLGTKLGWTEEECMKWYRLIKPGTSRR